MREVIARGNMAVRIDPPVLGMETVGDLLAALGCYWIVIGLAWLMVWPV